MHRLPNQPATALAEIDYEIVDEFDEMLEIDDESEQWAPVKVADELGYWTDERALD